MIPVFETIYHPLLDFMVSCYRFGFSGVVGYLLVGMATGSVTAIIAIFGEASDRAMPTWSELRAAKLWLAERFLGGLLCWPVLLIAFPLVPIWAVVIGGLFLLALGRSVLEAIKVIFTIA